MTKIVYDFSNPNYDLLRQAVFERLRRDKDWHLVENEFRYFDPYIELKIPDHQGNSLFHVKEVIWRLMVEGILAPGLNSPNPNMPWFHLTEFGNRVINSSEPNPYDSIQYLDYIRARIKNVDSTILTYLAESLSTHRHGNIIASTMMLGIAAERVFLMLCESMSNALASAKEKSELEKLLIKFPIKPKLDWMRTKIDLILSTKVEGFPDNASIMITAIYDLLRGQRNDLGHPREIPPMLRREDAFVNLQIFPKYYETAEVVRSFLSVNKI
jgi:hypothetical protein